MSDPLTPEQFRALHDRGYTPDQIASFEAKRDSEETASRGTSDATPSDMLKLISPQQVLSQLLRFAPNILGGVGQEVGGPIGAAAGGAVGEAGLRAAAGAPITPEAVGNSALTQGLFGVGAEALQGARGLAGRGARMLEGKLKERAVNKALERDAAMASARDISGPVRAAVGAAEAERGAAGRATSEALRGAAPAAGQTGLDAVAERIVGDRQRALGRPLDPRHSKTLLSEAKRLLSRGAKELSVGTYTRGKLSFDLNELNELKKFFQRQSGTRASYAAAERGAPHNPTLSKDAARALKGHIEDVGAEHGIDIGALNERTSKAIREVQSLKPLERAHAPGKASELRQLRSQRVEAARAGMIPGGIEPTVGFHGIGLAPRGGLAGAAGTVGRAFESTPADVTTRALGQVPRGIDLLRILLGESQPLDEGATQ